MKTRTWLCYALDIFGSIALLGAGLALLAALWFAGTVPELVLLLSFKYCLVAAVSAFLAARVFELTKLVRLNEIPDIGAAAPPSSDNVKPLRTPKRLPRAA